MIEKIQVECEKILYRNFFIHFVQDTINSPSDEATLLILLSNWDHEL
jgi:hypothetical protein